MFNEYASDLQKEIYEDLADHDFGLKGFIEEASKEVMRIGAAIVIADIIENGVAMADLSDDQKVLQVSVGPIKVDVDAERVRALKADESIRGVAEYADWIE